MRLLLDNNLSARLVDALSSAGWDVIHVRSLGLEAASDKAVLDAARSDARILVSADTDFGALLAASRASEPSIVLVRRVTGRRVQDLAALLIANLPQGRRVPSARQHRRHRRRHAQDPAPGHRLTPEAAGKVSGN